METITLPRSIWKDTGRFIGGHSIAVPVKVSWPELQLTEAQIVANEIARVQGRDAPYPDKSFINVVVPIPIEIFIQRGAARWPS